MKKLKTVPTFKNEAEEREFWETHDSSDYFDLTQAQLVTFPNLKPTPAHTQASEILHLLNNMSAHIKDFTKALHKLPTERQYALEALILEVDANMKKKGLTGKNPAMLERMKQIEMYIEI